MERKIGEIFEHNGEWYQCVESNDCKKCAFYIEKYKRCDTDSPDDYCCDRSDGKDVIYKKLEKVGEPYERFLLSNKSIKVQRYKLPYRYAILPKEPIMILEPNYKNSIEIEIKQNKEDMEEKKQNLKPFDLEKARLGKPVCTRDGRKARIICFDAKRKDKKSIIALVPSNDYPGFEDLIAYYNNGNYHGGHENDGDLMMLPEKRSGWAKVRKDINLYDTKEEADRKMIGNDEYVTAKVFWEE